MWDILYYLLVMMLLAATVVAGGIIVRGYMTGNLSTITFFPSRPEPRLDVMEQRSVDSRRRLVLIRRDDVEHLIMTGGPVDVVIETGIGAPAARSAEILEAPASVFSRTARSFGKAAGE